MNKTKFLSKFEKIEKYQPNDEKNTITISDNQTQSTRGISHSVINETSLIHYSNITAVMFQIKYGIIEHGAAIEYIINTEFPIKLFFFCKDKEIGVQIVNKVRKQLHKCLNYSERIYAPNAVHTMIGYFFVFPDYYFRSIADVKRFIHFSAGDLVKDDFWAIKHIPPLGMRQLNGYPFYDKSDNTKIKDFHLHFLTHNCNSVNKDTFRLFCF